MQATPPVERATLAAENRMAATWEAQRVTARGPPAAAAKTPSLASVVTLAAGLATQARAEERLV